MFSPLFLYWTLVVVQSLSHVQLFATPWTAAHQAPCPSSSPRACSNSCPLSRWCHPTISSSVAFFSYPQSFPASGSFPMSQLFTSGGQNIGVSASASVLPMNIQGWFPLGWTGLVSLQSKGLSTVFSNTTVQKHQSFRNSAFFITQFAHPYRTTGKTIALTRRTFDITIQKHQFFSTQLYGPTLTCIYWKNHSFD